MQQLFRFQLLTLFSSWHLVLHSKKQTGRNGMGVEIKTRNLTGTHDANRSRTGFNYPKRGSSCYMNSGSTQDHASWFSNAWAALPLLNRWKQRFSFSLEKELDSVTSFAKMQYLWNKYTYRGVNITRILRASLSRYYSTDESQLCCDFSHSPAANLTGSLEFENILVH